MINFYDKFGHGQGQCQGQGQDQGQVQVQVQIKVQIKANINHYHSCSQVFEPGVYVTEGVVVDVSHGWVLAVKT